jgi:hypothetical protein
MLCHCEIFDFTLSICDKVTETIMLLSLIHMTFSCRDIPRPNMQLQKTHLAFLDTQAKTDALISFGCTNGVEIMMYCYN